nr:ABC transporter ATP-binding protein [Lysinibacillus timonensis]
MAVLTIKDLSFQYPEEKNYALHSINLEIEEGEFVVLIGQSGCGKSTLLKHLKREIAPHGQLTGEIFYEDTPLHELEAQVISSEIGIVLQNPENQIVTDKVWHELAFGLENLGLDTLTIRRRVAEMANFFGIQQWFRKSTVDLSGGQKQLLNLASVMLMQPRILLLDEPTSQLNPIAASEFMTMLRKLNEELGLTIIMAEHRLEEVLPIASRVIVMEEGSIIYNGKPRNLLHGLPNGHAMLKALPSAMRIYQSIGGTVDSPLTIKEGRQWLQKINIQNGKIDDVKHHGNQDIVLEAKDVAFRYDKDGEDILRHFNLKIHDGEFLSVIGGNGAGKSTALKVFSGLLKPYRGHVFLYGRNVQKYSNTELYQKYMAVLPQDPTVLFVEKRVSQELQSVAKGTGSISKQEEIIELFGLGGLLERHPYDLSGGEQQKLAIAKLLLLNPRILLLDEPTKGLDAFAKQSLAETLKVLQKQRVTILMVTHDIEFSAEYSDRCALFFDGQIISSDPPRQFYCGNTFYTTAAHRMTRKIFENAITVEDVMKLCKKADKAALV